MFEKKAANPALPFFTALCMFLSAVEYAVPKPLPFMRLGLANVPLMLAFGFMNFSSVLLLAALKVFVQGVISGTLLSYVFVMSFFGTFLSVIFSFAAYSLFLLPPENWYAIVKNPTKDGSHPNVGAAYSFLERRRARFGRGLLSGDLQREL